jgi:copper chaperone CopZ
MSRKTLNIGAIVGGLFVLAVGVPLLVGQLRSLPGGEKLAARSGQRIVTLEVTGIDCGGCDRAVRGALAAIEGVSTVEVRSPQERAYVVVALDLPDSALTGAVSRAGPGFIARVVQK